MIYLRNDVLKSTYSTSSLNFDPRKNILVGKRSTGPYLFLKWIYSSSTLGNITYDITSHLRIISSPNCFFNSSSILSKSNGLAFSPGRPSIFSFPFNICVLSGSGNPPCG